MAPGMCDRENPDCGNLQAKEPGLFPQTAGKVREGGGQLGIRRDLKDILGIDNRQDDMTVSRDVL